MLQPDRCEDDTCTASHSILALHSQSLPTLTLAFLPFVITFIVVYLIASYKVFPLIAGLQQSRDFDERYVPSDSPPDLRKLHTTQGSRSTRRQTVTITFSATVALATVLAELILCEISNSLDVAARTFALSITVPTLLFFLVVLIPFLELQSFVSGSGWSFRRRERGNLPKTAWLLQALGFTSWLMGFWWLGKGIPGTYIYTVTSQAGKGVVEACLDRVGIIGISLMALLSGFAAVSAPWQTFGIRNRLVTESDVARKQVGLDTTNEMLVTKRSRLGALQRKMKDTPPEGFITKVMGTIRGSADAQESKALHLEISGLESMAVSLSSSLAVLRARRSSSLRASSPLGRLCLTPTGYAFSLYCIYRILTTSLTTLRRILSHSTDSSVISSSTTDPINRILSLIAKHLYPELDQLAWSRQISFLLSGIILLASFNSVLQTFHMLTKLSPSLLYQAQANLALIVGQISATYVISSALLLRSNLPKEMKSVVSEALGSPLEPGFVERWFDGWFMVASIGTGIGIWLGKKLAGRDDWEDFDDDIEMAHKRS